MVGDQEELVDRIMKVEVVEPAEWKGEDQEAQYVREEVECLEEEGPEDLVEPRMMVVGPEVLVLREEE